MAENSIPPKERINIVYRTKTNNQEADVELPLKLMVDTNLTGENQTPLEEREVVSINKINFDQVMKSLDIHTEFSVKNRLNSGSEDLNIDLNFESIQDFNPDNIINQVPELKKLLQLRKALVALKGPMGNMPDFRKAVLEAIKDEDSRKQLLLELKDEKDKE